MGAAISTRLSLDSIKPDDIVIAVVGQTGVGKSTGDKFINTAAGEKILHIEHSLRPNPFDVQHVECSNPEHYGERRVVFVDTPAFDSEREEKIIEKKLKQWLKSVSSKKLKISGILYLHRITDVKLSDPPLGRLLRLRKLCEESSQGFPNRVVLVTTMWGKLQSMETGVKREEGLQQHWDTLPRGSVVSRIMRFEDTFESAWSIVFALMGNPAVAKN